MEWYDYYIYGTATALVFNDVFFPHYEPLVASLLAFGTFSAGAVMRPLGGVICGHYGDKVGRKAILAWTLVAMGGCTFLTGLVPSYSAIGLAAPICLIVLRSVQGLAFGGEWAGAALMTVEHAPAKRAGLFGGIAQMGSPVGLFLSTGTFALLTLLPKTSFLSWGWRVPFLASGSLVAIGLYVRMKVTESPTFSKIFERGEIVSIPAAEVLRKNARNLLIGCSVVLSTTVAFYVQSIFVVSYATQTAGFARQVVLNSLLFAAASELVLIPVFAALADRLGTRPVALFGAMWIGCFSFPFFRLVDCGSTTCLTLATNLGMVGVSALFAVLPSYLSDLFPEKLRYTGISLSYGIASGLIGGLTPVISSSLYIWAQSSWPISVFVLLSSVISCFAVLGTSRSFRDRGEKNTAASNKSNGSVIE